MSNIIGIRNNNTIVPYSAATKRTKEVSLTVTGTNWTTTRAVGVAYADSLGVWRLCFNVTGSVSSGVTSFQATIGSPTSVVFKNTSNFFQAISGFSDQQVKRAWAGVGNGVLSIETSSTATTFAFSGDCELDAKPSWVDANMEGVTAVDVYIAPVSDGITGLFPALNTSLDNVTATRLGLKSYKHGTTYNNSSAPTIGAGADVSSIGIVISSNFVPYQLQDGTWRLKFSFTLYGATTATSSSHFITINAVVFKSGSQNFQACTGSTAYSAQCFVFPNENRVRFYYGGSGLQPTDFLCFGDVELNAKPTWAY